MRAEPHHVGHTVGMKKLDGEARLLGALVWPPSDTPRPRTRVDCQDGPRPCPWIGCRYHLLIEVTAAGSLKLNLGHAAPSRLDESCALDVADRGDHTLEAVATITGLTRERVRQIEERALDRLRRHGGAAR